MRKILLFIMVPLYVHSMQTVLTIDKDTHEIGISKPIPIRTNSPTDSPQDKLPLRTSPKPLTSPNIKTFDGMSVDEVKTWIVGTIAQYEEKHSLTLQELQTALAQHAQTTATAQNTAQSAQNSSKYAVIAAAVTGGCSIIICIASSLMSHYL